jgi:hypothetical protein
MARSVDEGRLRAPFVLPALVALAAVLVLAARAGAERPGFYARPSLVGEPKVGAELVGDAEGIRCSPACIASGPEPERAGIFYQWIACKLQGGGGREAPPGGLPDEGGPCAYPVIVRPATTDPAARRFVVPDELVGMYVQFEVIARTWDCGAPNYQAGSQECRYAEAHGWSATVGPIEPPPPPPTVAPTNTAAPAIAGTAEDGQTLTVAPGTWTGTDPIAYAFQWLRCSRANNGCAPIAGATEAEYRVTFDDLGARLTAAVTASNAAGTAAVNAPLTGKVAGARPREGADTLDVTELRPAHRLVIESATFAPKVLRSGGRLTVRVQVEDRRGFRIAGALVTASSPRGGTSAARAVTREDGTAVLRLRIGDVRRRGAVVVALVAAKADDDDRPARRRLRVPVRS